MAGKGDFSAVPLADDLEFTGPVASFDTAEGFRQMAAQAGPLVTRFTVRRQFADGDTVCSIIDWEMDLPVAPMMSAEILQVRDGKIVRGELIYDAGTAGRDGGGRTAAAVSNAGEQVLLAKARTGDEDAFGVLIAPYTRELHVHCYRMLGSVHDAEDVLQEVLVRAWRHLASFDGHGSVRGWLYRIATNRCLTARSRAAAFPSPVLTPAHPPPNALDVEVTALQPYPDEWLREMVGPADPAASYELRESVRLAFLTVIQLLPPRQRAVLLLRDVLAFSAPETARILGVSQPSVNSALQRARSTLEAHRESGRLRQAQPPAPRAERALADRFTAAWHACDVPTRANGQPGMAAYMRDGDTAQAYGIMVLTVHAGLIGEITGFADPELFLLFGLRKQAAWPPYSMGR
jgi:RNA polymerase sigma factor (sigma-70 family)